MPNNMGVLSELQGLRERVRALKEEYADLAAHLGQAEAERLTAEVDAAIKAIRL